MQRHRTDCTSTGGLVALGFGAGPDANRSAGLHSFAAVATTGAAQGWSSWPANVRSLASSAQTMRASATTAFWPAHASQQLHQPLGDLVAAFVRRHHRRFGAPWINSACLRQPPDVERWNLAACKSAGQHHFQCSISRITGPRAGTPRLVPSVSVWPTSTSRARWPGATRSAKRASDSSAGLAFLFSTTMTVRPAS